MTEQRPPTDAIEWESSKGLIGRRVVAYPRVGSTNDEAKRLAEAGEPEGTLVIADEQTAGRGRLQRTWWAPAGTALLMSLILRPELAPHQAQRLTMLCSLAICDAITEVTGLTTAVKWPNDVLLRGRKVCGILTDLGIEGSRLVYAVVGMGINVNVNFHAAGELASTATSLAQELGHEVSRAELLRAILIGLEERYTRLRAGDSPHVEWTARLATVGQQVTIATSTGQLSGVAEGVDADGALLLRDDNGALRRILAGDVTSRTKRT
ncbi:MAG: biotin--[acetyl-CoA-carboxylase] ligase [Chloroflexota bacterium]|nr:biotin--[acetyl-CoA-carboxylase] ligase [Chloroflexota bacterium]